MWQLSGRALSGNMPSMINCSSYLVNLRSITQNDSLDGQAAQAGIGAVIDGERRPKIFVELGLTSPTEKAICQQHHVLYSALLQLK